MTYRIPLACCLGALLALVGCDGESPVERPDGCVPAARDHVTCSDGDLYWVDSCGARGELSQGCDAPCAPGATTCPDPEDPTSLYLEAEEGTVLQQVQRGYQLNDRLVRPARVVVAKAPPPS